MSTYNLSAADLITLLNSTVTTPTGRAILESVSSAFSSAFPFGATSVQTTTGPADSTPGGYTVMTSDTVAAGVQLELITVPGSTTLSGSAFTAGTVGTTVQTAITPIALTTSGGVVIAAGDQFTSIRDSNTGSTSDTLIGGAFTEKLVSLAGNNLLVGGSGFNSLVGGTGTDTLIGGGHSRLVAGSSNNILRASTLAGGHDTLVSSGFRVVMEGEGSDARIVSNGGLDTLKGGSGHDTLVMGGQSSIVLGSGNTRVVQTVGGAHDTILGGSGSSTVKLTFGTTIGGESIVGSSGSLRIVDATGSNTIVGGSGGESVVLSNFFGFNPTLANTANQTILAGTGTIRVVTNESFNNYTVTQAGSQYTVNFTDTNQTLAITDASGSSVTIVFGDGHAAVHI